ncbi:MAG: hypothetical protein QOF48_389 [Verrucomicrobiota bacterium]
MHQFRLPGRVVLEILGEVFPQPSSFHVEWRNRGTAGQALRESDEIPPERLLQVVWYHQRLRRGELRTHDGRALRVLHPGFWNREAGPDFRAAVIQFEGEAPQTTDIEIDLHSAGWRAHKHEGNPNFVGVALHVVWRAERPIALPTLALEPVLDAPLSELERWLGSETAGSFPLELFGQCCAPLRGFDPERLTKLLQEAALVRFQSKAAQFQARAREAGWEQALWEGLFRALGYKHNVWPMQRLAELRAQLDRDKGSPDPLALQARLLGVAGLLPDQLPGTRAGTDNYPRRLWDIWWRERDSCAEVLMPRSLWRFSGIRPANHPQRRVALAAHWLAARSLPARLEKWAVAGASEISPAHSLLELFQAAGADEFWSWHWTLRSKRLSKPQSLLGATRVTELAVNVVLPWLWIRAVEGKNDALRLELEQRFLAWPSAEDNAVLRLARQRLLGRAPARVLRGAAAQQGLLQVVRDFCQHSNSLCADCRFPALVRQWPG